MRLLFLHLPILIIFLGRAPHVQGSNCMFGILQDWELIFSNDGVYPLSMSDERIPQFGDVKCSDKCADTQKCVFSFWQEQEKRCRLYDLRTIYVFRKIPNPQKKAIYYLKTPPVEMGGRYYCTHPAPNYYNQKTVSVGAGKYNLIPMEVMGEAHFQITPKRS